MLIDYDTEINHNIGIKSSLSMIPLAFVNEGDIVFQTIPYYPVWQLILDIWCKSYQYSFIRRK